MASKPPRDAISNRTDPPKVPVSKGDPLSSSIALIDLLGRSGLILAPAIPTDRLVEAAAKKNGITADQALGAFRTIAGYGQTDIH